jgi:hypothetical protein
MSRALVAFGVVVLVLLTVVVLWWVDRPAETPPLPAGPVRALGDGGQHPHFDRAGLPRRRIE